MREQRADTTRAVVLALLLHVALFALMFAGLWWTRSAAPLSAAGSPISAELIDVSDLSPAMQRTLQRRPEPVPPEPLPVPEPEPVVVEDATPEPQPIPVPLPEDAPVEPQPTPQVQVPEPSPVDQEAVRRDAIARETAEREQEAKRRQEQIDLTERKRQEEAEQKRRLAEQKLAEIRRQREQAQREQREAERRLERIAQSRAEQAPDPAPAAGTPPPGNQGVDPGLSARYAAAIQEAILRNWTRPENVPLGQKCRIVITQVRGGTVVRVEVSPTCPFDDLGRRSVEAAVLKAQPLPYAGFESVFNRTLNLNFEAQDR
ncbi:TonB C-terminal domain-containing protein [Luteimonas granuli]|uniref:Protein TolA n=1 Tax=Luteimonas granuli TaxID=1176533 RepID=A0A518N5J9_9GAMM|nr:TonB C-terminal domain-containing protein [Luteimonas granuli]QDW67196.1 protein TolA [Luteimonas granuli]